MKDILDTLGLIDSMLDHHQAQAKDLAAMARWHKEQAKALQTERFILAADVSEVMAEAERLLQ